MAKIVDMYKKHRFSLVVDGKSFGATNVSFDPFSDQLFIERGHYIDGPTLRDLLEGKSEVDIIMFPGLDSNKQARCITVKFKDYRWMPIMELDACESGVAIEAIAILSPVYSPAKNVPPVLPAG